jgi:hypothetical protein
LKPPPEGRFRGAITPPSPVQHHIKKPPYLHGRLLSAFVTHGAALLR